MKKGFTLVELLGVIAIIAIVMIIAIPNYLSSKNTAVSALNDIEKRNITEAIKMYKLDNPNASSVTMQTLINTGYLNKLNRNCNINQSININNIDNINLQNITCTN